MLQSLEACDAPFEKAAAYFLFAADNKFYFDRNKRTARAMMNGLLLAAGVHAALVPAQAREEFNETMRDFDADRDATAAMALLGVAGLESTRLVTGSCRLIAHCGMTSETNPLQRELACESRVRRGRGFSHWVKETK